MARPGMMGRLMRVFLCRRQAVLGLLSFAIVLLIWANMHILSCVTENSEPAPYVNSIRLVTRLVTVPNTTVNSRLAPFQVGAMKLNVDPQKALLYGRRRTNQSELTIGIPTIQRQGADYLEKTLHSLIIHSKAAQRNSIVVVIFMVDRNETWTKIRSKQLARKYPRLIRNGFLQIVHPHDQSIYPDFTTLKRTFNDSEARVSWRSKQNIDYAYLFSYCKGISKYYLQLEDDVIAASNYYDDIMTFIESKSDTFWYSLEFSFLGFIGKLLRSSDLQELSEYILMFFDEQPGDLLFKALKPIKTQWKDIQSGKSLFQHKGIISSLTDKEQHLHDGRFKDGNDFNLYSKKRFYHVNPSAMIDSKIDTYSNYEPMYAYDISDKYFWGVNPKQGDYFRITFEAPQNISRLYVDSGEVTKTSDMLHHARLLVSTAVEVDKPCQNLVNITNFVDGDVDTRKSNISLPLNVDCIVIEITNNQTDWVIIREIAVFLPGELEVEAKSEKENAPKLQGESKIIKWQTWKKRDPLKPRLPLPQLKNGVLVFPGQELDPKWQDQRLQNAKRRFNQNQNQNNANFRSELNKASDQQKMIHKKIDQFRERQGQIKPDDMRQPRKPDGVYLRKDDQHLLDLWQHQVNMNKQIMKNMKDIINGAQPQNHNDPFHNHLPPHIENGPIKIDHRAQRIGNQDVPLDRLRQSNVQVHNKPHPQMQQRQIRMDPMRQNNDPLHDGRNPNIDNEQIQMDRLEQKNIIMHNEPQPHIDNEQIQMDRLEQKNIIMHNEPQPHIEYQEIQRDRIGKNNVRLQNKPHAHIDNEQIRMDRMEQNNIIMHNKPYPHIEYQEIQRDQIGKNNDPLQNKPQVHIENEQIRMDRMEQNNIMMHNKPHPHIENHDIPMNQIGQNNVPMSNKPGTHIGNLKRRVHVVRKHK